MVHPDGAVTRAAQERLPRVAVRDIGAEGERLLHFVEPDAAAHAVVIADPA